MFNFSTRARALVAAGVAAALTVGAASASAAAPASPGGPVPPGGTATALPPSAAGSRSVTLITGDMVTVTTAADGTTVTTVTGPGGTTSSYHRTERRGSTYVYPDAALPYVTAGTLDDRLFNVTRLLADGYDDASADTLPLIVRYTEAAARSRGTAPLDGSDVVRALPSVDGAAVAQDRSDAVTFWTALTDGGAAATARAAGDTPAFAGGIEKVWLDGPVTADLAESTAQIGAPEVWADGNTGAGVDVAVLDTGIDPTHPDLADQIAASATFVPTEDYVEDYIGHGTHVASTIAGTGAASDGLERGVAPGARLHVGKVLDSNGQGLESWIIAGMEWAARDQDARVVSMSLGGEPAGADDPMAQAVDELTAETGALFVTAAGNGGPRTISTPALADSALTVGAVDATDTLAGFSSTGPALDGGIKPEVTAPGVDVLAARSQLVRGSGMYTTMSGTSMATPHVAGTAALVAAAHPGWTAQQIKEAIVSTAVPTPAYTAYEAGSGRVDAAAAVDASVFGTASAGFGFHTFGSGPDELSKPITYTNLGDAPVELDLAVDGTVPAGFLALSSSSVTVPAHGTAAVTLTADLSLLPADADLSATVVATDDAGTVRARTLTGATREGQRQELTVTVKGDDGRPATGKLLVTSDEIFAGADLDEDGTAVLRMPVGSYSGWLSVDVEGANGPGSLGTALLSFVDVDLSQDRSVVLDARKAVQVRAEVPQDTDPAAMRLDVIRQFPNGGYTASSMFPAGEYDSLWALPTGKKVTDGLFEFGAQFRLEQPALTILEGRGGLDDLRVKRGTTPLTAGTRTLRVVEVEGLSDLALHGSAGNGHGPGLRDAAVIAHAADTDEIAALARAAADAGARLLLVVHDGDGRLAPWDESPWIPGEPAPLTVATLTSGQGAELLGSLDHRRPEVTVTSHPTTDYVYDVVHHWTGAIPARPAWTSTRRDLARVDTSFRNYRQGPAMEARFDVWHGWTAGNQLVAPAQGERTDWVTADVPWTQSAYISGEMGQSSIDVLRYGARTTSDVTWFGPVLRPRMGLGSQPIRYLDQMYVPVPGWGDSGSGHVGSTGGGNFDVRNRATLYQGDTELLWGNAEFLPVNAGLPAERLPYRVVADNDRADWAGPYSTHTHTEWDFTSEASGPDAVEPLPLIQLDYGVDTDLAGRASRTARLTVTPSHLPGIEARVGRPAVEVSYDDGATWRRLDLTRDRQSHGPDAWSARLSAPRGAQFATLRTVVEDADGNRVSQTLTRAFGLR
ncbi:subtilisin family serine protease [Promicromonospora sp. AC04]|uniref:S8 family serine peptidase n=1 Tax=Promicromonospora sp. AC04 TaxID=2135723 RepID=UPI000D3A48AD|nr:S8 family serine peptidase [Promicromonospora sp. AC04]PUB29927.1 subtilisin family serine protease [Promicromonospora sp. AC04]